MGESIKLSTQGVDSSPALYGDKTPEGQDAVTARSRYEELATERDGYLRRARVAAKLTIPSLFPEAGVTGSTDLPTPWQAVGSKGLLSLSAKLLLALFPPGQSWFRQQPTNAVVEQLRAQFPEGAAQFTDAKTALEGELAKQERTVSESLEAAGFRPVMSEGLKQVLVSGNMLVQMLDEGGINVYRMDRFVVCRDCDGNVIEVILHQTLDKRALPVGAKALYDTYKTEAESSKREVDLYTWIVRSATDKTYAVRQEILGHTVPGSDGSWPLDKPAFFPVAINRIPGETYGRGHIEMYLGDLLSHDSLSQSVVQGTAALVRTVTLVDEGGQTQKRELQTAENGDYIDGRKDDVHVLQSEKSVDLQVARVLLGDIAKRMDEAFLNATSIQRDAERVTAEEIRLLAQELENSFGGIYSLLSSELQRPLAVRRILTLQKSGEIPKLPNGTVKTVVVAGLAALGRSSDLQRLIEVMKAANDVLLPNSPVAEYTNVGDFLQKLCTSGGVEFQGLFKTEAQVQQQRQQQQMRDIAAKVGPSVVKAHADMAMHASPPAQAAPPAAS